MRVVIQKVTEASVAIEGRIRSSIQKGLLIFLGITAGDSSDDIDYLCHKIIHLRIFEDDNRKMNLALADVKGEILLISQFTLYASTKKGNRPSFILAAGPDISKPLYENFVRQLNAVSSGKVKTGEFGADMKIALINDGPVTIIIDSKEKE